MQDKQPTPGEITIMASGAVAFIFSFVPWFGYAGIASANAWDTGIFPVMTYLGIFGLIMAGQVAATKFGSLSLPDRVMSFTWTQIHVIMGLFTTLLGVGFLITSGDGKKLGLYVSAFAGIGLLVGAILLQKERDGTGSY